MRIVFVGGHLTPAIATIDAVQELRKDAEVHFFGRKHAMEGDKTISHEYKVISARKLLFYNIVSGRLQRKFTRYTIWSLLKIPVGLIQSGYLLMKIRPDVIVTYGGYLAVPVAIAGWVLRIPIVTHEQTILPGLANKIVARFADKIALTFPDSKMNYSENGIDKQKIVITGNPIRKSIYYSGEVNKKMLPTLFVTCGNQGSHFVNELIFRNLNRLLSFCEIVHQTGENSLVDDYATSLKIKEGLAEEFRKRYLPMVYVQENEIGKIYAEASVVLSRGGVNTLIELVALNKRGIIIPGHAEQLANGQFLEKIGLGICLRPHSLKDEDFIGCVQSVIRQDDPNVAFAWRDLYESAEWKLAGVILEYSKKL